MPVSFFLIPLLAALLGWLMMSLAINRILYHYLPSQKKSMALTAANLVEQEFLGSPLLAEKLASQETIDGILPMIETEIDEFLRVRLKASMPVVGMFIGEKTIGQLKAVFMEELVRLFPQIMSQLATQLPAKLNIRQLIGEKLDSLGPDQWKQMIQANLGAASRQFALLGALLGFLVSVLTLALTVLLS